MGHFISFMVTLETQDRISDDNEIDEMSGNIARAIIHECRNGDGIVPENSETFTNTVYVKGWYSNNEIIEHP